MTRLILTPAGPLQRLSAPAAGDATICAGTLRAVRMTPVKRFICHFLIVWLALLSSGAHAHAASDAAHAMNHAALHASHPDQVQDASPVVKKVDSAHGNEHSDTCLQSHCGHSHATGLLAATGLRLSDIPAAAPLPTRQAWVQRDAPSSIDRPKWRFTTPAVVNL
jgi:hypothetical protein